MCSECAFMFVLCEVLLSNFFYGFENLMKIKCVLFSMYENIE